MSNGKTIALAAAGLVLVGVAGWFGGRMAIERVVHDYILEHPEILPQAMENLQNRQNSDQLASIRQAVQAPFPGAVLGNPDGKVTLVEFSDYACGYCRKSAPDVAALAKEHPDLRIVVRELPIIGPHSPDAARMALAAAEQGKFAAFHQAMFAAGQVDPASIEAAAKSAGLDLERARKVMESDEVEAEINRNYEMANHLGFSGTPSWVAGERLIAGAVGVEQLSDAVEAARGS
jgi:protein-disulfide isomerase